MGQMLRGIHIDPYECTVKEVLIDSDKFLKQVYKLCRCDMIEYVYRTSRGRPLHMFVDEEGRIRKPQQRHFAIQVDELNDCGEELCGPVVILGEADEEGNEQSAPDWCTPRAIEAIVLWPSQSIAEHPGYWLIKILMIGGPKSSQFACTYLNPHEVDKLQKANKDMSAKDVAGLMESKKIMGSVFYKPEDFGFSNSKFSEAIEEAGSNPLMQELIMDALDKIRHKVATEILKIPPSNLLLMREPVLRNPKTTGEGKENADESG